MRLVIQRVSEASVAVDGRVVGSISRGLMILVGVENGDTEDDARWLAHKVVAMRIFDDAQGIMNCDVTQIGGEILVISQFTLHASTRKGNRPSYIRAAARVMSEPLYEEFVSIITEVSTIVPQKGIFGANMKVALVNDGPVTIVIDSKLRE